MLLFSCSSTVGLIYIVLRCTRKKDNSSSSEEKLASAMVPVQGEELGESHEGQEVLSPYSTVDNEYNNRHTQQYGPACVMVGKHVNNETERDKIPEALPRGIQRRTNSLHDSLAQIVERVISTVEKDVERIFALRDSFLTNQQQSLGKPPTVNSVGNVLQHTNKENVIGSGMAATVHKVNGSSIGLIDFRWIAAKIIHINDFVQEVVKNGWPEELIARQLSIEVAVSELIAISPHQNLLNTLSTQSSPFCHERRTISLFSGYRECETLADTLMKHGPLDEEVAKNIIGQVSKALYHMHHNLLMAHRDIKLDNVILENHDTNLRHAHVEVVDFGHSRPLLLNDYVSAVTTSLTQEGRSRSAAHESRPYDKKYQSNSILRPHTGQAKGSSTNTVVNPLMKQMTSQIANMNVDCTFGHIGGTLHYKSPELLIKNDDPSLRDLAQEIEDYFAGKVENLPYSSRDLFSFISHMERRCIKKNITVNARALDLRACDVWALGVVGYALVCGTLPFYSVAADSPAQLWEQNNAAGIRPVNFVEDIIKLRIRWGQFATPIDSLDVSPACKSFLTKCLEPNVDKRITVEEILRHRWLN